MKVIINPTYEHLRGFVEQIPDVFEKDENVVYDGRNILKRMNLGNVNAVIKRFKKPHFVNRVVYSFFRQSKATRSYIYSMEIQKHGFDTPEPIAMIEQYQGGLLSYSYYICCYDNGDTVRNLMEENVEGNEDKLLAFARYTAKLHQAGILHLDYSPGNILIHRDDFGKYSFSLVDVNRMQLMSNIDCDTVCRNLCRLCISREVLAFIMTEYASLQGWDVKQTVDLSLYYTNKFFKHYAFRRAVRKEPINNMVSRILLFRLSRSLRSFLPHSSKMCDYLWGKEKRFYDTHLQKYDYQGIFLKEYRQSY